MLTYEEKLRACNRLNKMNFHFEQGGMKFETVWNKLHLTNETQWNYKEHRHSFYEIHICLEGECSIKFENEEIMLKPGTFLVIAPHITHKINYVSKDFSKFVLGIKIAPEEKSCKFALKLFEEENKKPRIWQTPSEIIECINNMIENTHSRQFNYYDIIKIQLYSIVVYAMRQASTVRNYTEAVNRETHDARIDAVRDFIKDNLALKFTNENVAQQLNISSRQLSRIIAEETGMTIGDLKRTIQVETIRDYLKNTEYTLKEIAMFSWFSDEFSMSKMFKRTEGMPPREYRKGLKT